MTSSVEVCTGHGVALASCPGPFHIRHYDERLAGNGRYGKQVEKLYVGNQDGEKHIRFPTRLWAIFEFRADPRSRYETALVGIEECLCPDDEVISASEYMSIRQPVKWLGQQYGTQSHHNYAPRVEVKVEWSGERQPVLTRAQRQELASVDSLPTSS